MHLILTRPRPDSERLAEALAGRGHQSTLMPLLEISPIRDVQLTKDDWQAVLVTSANGVRAAATLDLTHSLRDVPVLAVGEASADEARSAGFGDVNSANGNLEGLAALARDRLDPARGPLLYLCGEAISGDLKGMLEQHGFLVGRAVIYRAEAMRALSDEVYAGLKDGRFDGVVLFSPRTARVWSDLVTRAGLWRDAGNFTHYCLSAAVSRALSGVSMAPDRIITARAPTQAALLDLIGKSGNV